MGPIITYVIDRDQDHELIERLCPYRDLVVTNIQLRPIPTERTHPQLLFVVMSDGTSGEDLRYMLEHFGRPKWVMVSASASDGILAFDHGAIDLLLKPYNTDRLEKCLDRVRRSLAEERSRSVRAAVDPTDGKTEKILILKSGKEQVKVLANKIQLVQGMGNYTKLHMGGTHVLVSSTMAHLSAQLPADKFVRIHRSFIMNIEHVRSIGSNTIEWEGGEISFGAVYKAKALSILKRQVIEGHRNK